MPKAKSPDDLLQVEDRAALSNGPTLRGHAMHPREEPNFVRAQLLRIATLADEGHRSDARAASADLLFDFQPLILAHPDLASRCVDVLRRCEATALLRRFLVAGYGDAVIASAPSTRTTAPHIPGKSEGAPVRRGRQSMQVVPRPALAKQEP